MIKPEYQFMYLWDFMQRGSSINIGIRGPEEFDASQIKVDLSKDKSSICVSIPNEPPLVAGKLFKSVKSISTRAQKNTFIIALFLDSVTEWPAICVAPHVETNQIDPLSAYTIYRVNSKSSDPEVLKCGIDFLMHSISLGFPPALVSGYGVLMAANNEKKAKECLNIAAERYNSSQAYFQLGMNVLENDDGVEEALKNFEISANLGSIYGKSFIGFILSPLSDIKYSKKDGKKAAQIFEEVLSKEEDPTTMHEYAMLLYNGVGVEKDEKRALMLQEKAKKLVKDVPELIIKEVETSQIEKEEEKTENEQENGSRIDKLERKIDNLSNQVKEMNEKLDLIISLLQKK